MYNPAMIKNNFDKLRRSKALVENRDISLRKVAEESGLSVGTIQRVRQGETAKVYVSTIETLCRYFCVTSISELIEYVPEGK